MRHKVKKIKFKKGQDANQMLMRKLLINFLSHGHIETTITKAKVLKSLLEKLISKAKVKNEANKNYLLKKLGKISYVNDCFDRIGQALKNINGGYVKIVRLGLREGDGALKARVEWAYPILNEKNDKKEKIKNKKTNKK